MNFDIVKKYSELKWYKWLDIKVGQQLEIHETIWEGTNKRTWKFKGLVLKVSKPSHHDGTFTIRGVSSGLSIEKIYPFSFKNFEKIILLDEYKIRRAKLYYMREKIGKDAKLKSLLTNAEREKVIFEKASA